MRAKIEITQNIIGETSEESESPKVRHGVLYQTVQRMELPVLDESETRFTNIETPMNNNAPNTMNEYYVKKKAQNQLRTNAQRVKSSP